MTAPLVAPCGKTHSRSGKPWTEQTLMQHMTGCINCHEIRDFGEIDEDLGLEMTDLIAAGEENDGVYWGIAFELGEGF